MRYFTGMGILIMLAITIPILSHLTDLQTQENKPITFPTVSVPEDWEFSCDDLGENGCIFPMDLTNQTNMFTEVAISSSQSFYPDKETRLFSMEDSYQFDEDTWLCVGDCMHPLRQVPFVDLCNEMDGTAYFNSKGDGIICDLPQQNSTKVIDQ